MGVSLTLLPLRVGSERESAFATIVLPLHDDSILCDAIRALPSEPAPRELWTYFVRHDDPDEDTGLTTDDAYGEPLRMVTVNELLTVPEKEWQRTGGRTIAALRYLQAIDLRARVVLYWD